MKTRITFEFDSDIDCEKDMNAHIHGPKLAECLYEVHARVAREWEKCEEGSVMSKLIDDVGAILDNLGGLEEYTE